MCLRHQRAEAMVCRSYEASLGKHGSYYCKQSMHCLCSQCDHTGPAQGWAVLPWLCGDWDIDNCCCLQGTGKLQGVEVEDWTRPTIDSWRHSIWVGVYDPWIVIFKGPVVWYRTMREIVTLERMHRAFDKGLMQYGMMKAVKVDNHRQDQKASSQTLVDSRQSKGFHWTQQPVEAYQVLECFTSHFCMQYVCPNLPAWQHSTDEAFRSKAGCVGVQVAHDTWAYGMVTIQTQCCAAVCSANSAHSIPQCRSMLRALYCVVDSLDAFHCRHTNSAKKDFCKMNNFSL